MNFNHLSDVLETAQNAQNQREKSSQGAYQKGMRALIRASQEGFENKKYLHIARRCFFETIQNQRTHPEGYLGLGYLLLLIGQPYKAQEFIIEGLKYAEDKSYGEELLSYCQRLLASENLGNQEEEHLLLREMRQTCQYYSQNIAAQLNVLSPHEIQTHLERGQQLLANFNERLEHIEMDIDLPEGHQLKRKIAEFLEALHARLQGTQALDDLQKNLKTLFQDVLEFNRSLRQGEAVQDPEALLERLIDTCDYCADLLDQFGAEGKNVDALIADYERVVAEIETLQDMLDQLNT